MTFSFISLIMVSIFAAAIFSPQCFGQNYQDNKIHCSRLFQRENQSIQMDLNRQFKSYEEAIQGMSQLKAQLVENLEKMSLIDVVHEAQNSMDDILKTQSYLPGCTPEWTVRRVDELITDFYSVVRGGSILHQVIGNLGSVDTIDLILKKYSGGILPRHQDLIKLWSSHVWNYHVFRVLENRLSQTNQIPEGLVGYQFFHKK